MKEEVEAGAFDVVVAPTNTVRGPDQVGLGSSRPHAGEIARAGVGVGVRAGAPKPDVGSVEAFKRTLLSAKSVAYNKEGTAGTLLSRGARASGDQQGHAAQAQVGGRVPTPPAAPSRSSPRAKPRSASPPSPTIFVARRRLRRPDPFGAAVLYPVHRRRRQRRERTSGCCRLDQVRHCAGSGRGSNQGHGPRGHRRRIMRVQSTASGSSCISAICSRSSSIRSCQ